MPGSRSTALFFCLALGITWTLQLPAALASVGLIAGPPERFMDLLGLGALGPLAAALVAAWREGGRARVREIFWPPTRVAPYWYAIALLGTTSIALASSAVMRALGGGGPWAYGPENAQHVAGLVVMPLVEEPGWRGFAMPRLRERYGALRASLILGVLWAAWHTMMFIVQWGTPVALASGMVNVVLGSVLFGWLFVRTRGSLLAAYLAHVSAHLDNPARALPDHPSEFMAYTIGIGVVALALLLGDRAAWRDT